MSAPPDDITDAELDAMEARANAATRAPWNVAEDSRFAVMQEDDAGDCCIGASDRGGNGPPNTREVFEIYDGCAPWRFPDGPVPNAVFIAHARADVPRLIAALREARRRLALAEPVLQLDAIRRGHLVSWQCAKCGTSYPADAPWCACGFCATPGCCECEAPK